MNDGITTERFTLNLERCLTRCRIPRESLRVFVADDVLTGQLVAEFLQGGGWARLAAAELERSHRRHRKAAAA